MLMNKIKSFLLSSVKSLVYVCHFRERHTSSGNYSTFLYSRNGGNFRSLKKEASWRRSIVEEMFSVCAFGSRDL